MIFLILNFQWINVVYKLLIYVHIIIYLSLTAYCLYNYKQTSTFIIYTYLIYWFWNVTNIRLIHQVIFLY